MAAQPTGPPARWRRAFAGANQSHPDLDFRGKSLQTLSAMSGPSTHTIEGPPCTQNVTLEGIRWCSAAMTISSTPPMKRALAPLLVRVAAILPRRVEGTHLPGAYMLGKHLRFLDPPLRKRH
jgi:hypothetical protein